MIAANYASSWVGYLILAAVKGLVQSITLLWLKPFFLVCLGVSFLLSLLIERPVVRWILRCHGKSWKQALRRTFQLHAVSYPLLVAYYFSASGVSLMTDFDLVDTQELIPSISCTVYYLSVDGASVMRCEIGSEHVPEQVYDWSRILGMIACLFVQMKKLCKIYGCSKVDLPRIRRHKSFLRM